MKSTSQAKPESGMNFLSIWVCVDKICKRAGFEYLGMKCEPCSSLVWINHSEFGSKVWNIKWKIT